jgi:hypothetical protein
MSEADDSKLLEALRHPLRREVLRWMHGKGAVSQREIANGMEMSLEDLSYHVRALAKYEAIALAHKRQPARGSMQNYYCFAIEAEWALEMLGLSAG